MRKQLLSTMVFCATCLVIGAQAQSSTDPSSPSGSSSSTPGSPGYSSSQSGWSGRAGAGHMGHQDFKASQLTGAQVTGSSGSEVGTISDLIVNAGSGRIDCAIISLSAPSSSGSATSPSGTSTSSGTSSSQGSSSSVGGASASAASATGGKQVAVPWMLLRSSPSAAAGATTGAAQPATFVFTGDTTKLESAPSFDPNTDLTQPTWRHTIFSYFGLSSGGAATGAGETPGGSSGSSSSSQDTTPSSPTSPTTPTSPK